MRRLLLSFMLACKSEPIEQAVPPAPSKVEPEPAPVPSIDPNDPFAPYPGAVSLCNRVMISDGKPLHWQSWTSAEDYAKVVGHYKNRTKGMPVKESAEKTEIAQSPIRVLKVYPAALASSHPQCNKPLAPEDKTVIMVSELRMP